ncbi:metallophosphoesterase [Facklamia sp. DSM 111018]|uniref:Metallophosphoesterase n=1 Tax=Facklamia lactis TaxID=2749967 RepID=A0ABS0LRD8_9LACT|nr:metallophosphoesterase [Facklamia lactis]MBG9980119.1 metallophosphoesterase [Facklamia lactis]MBG9985921.1 metallophosphoesterase [Facklamia lactis]
MRIAFIADIHYDLQTTYTKFDLFEKIKNVCQANNADLLVVAGDISNDYLLTIHFMEKLQDFLGFPTYFVPGNHDFWSNKQDAWDLLKLYQEHPQSLMREPILLQEDWLLIGTCAWYNHYANKGRHSKAFLDKGYYQGYHWMDKQKIYWGKDDSSMSQYFCEQVEEQLGIFRTDHIILVTHMVTIPELQIPSDPKFQEDIDYFNAFISTNDFDKIYRDFPIKYSCMGHVHSRQSCYRDQIQFHTCCLGTEREWAKGTDLLSNITEAMKWVEI